MKNRKVEWMVKVSMLSAAAMVLMLFEFPMPFIAPPFYEMDLSEVPVLLGTFALGPLAGVMIEAIKIILNLLLNGTKTAGVGEFANFLVGIAFVLPAALVYKCNKTKKSAVWGMILGSVIMVTLGGFLNAYVLIPTYGKAFKMPLEAFVQMGAKIFPIVDSVEKLVLFCVVPFNIIKVIVVSLVTTLIYKPLSPILKVKKK